MSEPFHFKGFNDIADMFSAFQATQSGEDIIYCQNEGGMYEEWCWIVFEKDGKLYEVNASHCSCYGYEGQWEPELTDIESLRLRLNKGSLSRWPKSAELIEWLDQDVEVLKPRRSRGKSVLKFETNYRGKPKKGYLI